MRRDDLTGLFLVFSVLIAGAVLFYLMEGLNYQANRYLP